MLLKALHDELELVFHDNAIVGRMTTILKIARHNNVIITFRLIFVLFLVFYMNI